MLETTIAKTFDENSATSSIACKTCLRQRRHESDDDNDNAAALSPKRSMKIPKSPKRSIKIPLHELAVQGSGFEICTYSTRVDYYCTGTEIDYCNGENSRFALSKPRRGLYEREREFLCRSCSGSVPVQRRCFTTRRETTLIMV